MSTTYRELLDQWKTSGRAGKKVDDALWARFKAAGDALYGARIEREAVDAEESREKIAAKRGHNIAVVAAARRQLEFVYYALRDHHVRALDTPPTTRPAA